MEFRILDTNFTCISVVDNYISAIWTERYNEAGDFEISLPFDENTNDVFKEDYYVTTDDSEYTMIIENIEMTHKEDKGQCVTVTGRSLEQILDRRIILEKTKFEIDVDTKTAPSLQDSLLQLLTDNVINPNITARKISNFNYVKSSDEKITSLTIEATYLGDDLYEVVSYQCKENDIGFKINIINDDDTGYVNFVFSLYAGTDRSFKQSINPYVIFSPSNDNFYDTNYLKSSISKNVAIIIGEVTQEETDELKEIRDTLYIAENTEIAGLTRKEVYVDGSSVSRSDITYDEYKARLKQLGINSLIDNMEVESLEGEIDSDILYRYGVDFKMGDIVQLIDEYGHEKQARVTELVRAKEESGTTFYPTFVILNEGEYEYE